MGSAGERGIRREAMSLTSKSGWMVVTCCEDGVTCRSGVEEFLGLSLSLLSINTYLKKKYEPFILYWGIAD